LAQREFAAQEGVPLSTLTYWLRRARAKPGRLSGEPLGFREVSLPTVLTAGPAWVAEVTLPGGPTLRLGAGIPESLVQQLLGALGC
jgi:hypothetical protein